MRFSGKAGDDNFIGTDGEDRFVLRRGGVDSVVANGGDDEVDVYQRLEAGSRFDGGEGSNDELYFFGDVPDGFAFTGDNLVNFEIVDFFGHVSASIATGCNPVGHELFVGLAGDGNSIDASSVAGTLDAYVSDQASFIAGMGNDRVDGSNGAQHLDGGAGNDIIDGSVDNDILTGGSGADQFSYYIEHDQVYSVGHDVVTDFEVSVDVIAIVSQSLLKFSQLEFIKDGHGGTIVKFDDVQSVDLEHVARSTLSKSNFTFYDPVPQTPAGMASALPTAFALHAQAAPTMIQSHVDFGGLHIMEHAALL